MTSEDIRNVTFEQVRKGYRVEDVDDFLLQVAGEMTQLENDRNAAVAERASLEAQIQNLVADKQDAEEKMYVLAEKVEEYRGQEDILKTALINAQRMGETVVKEAKQKADQMLREATGQSELLREKAEAEARKEQETLEGLISEVNRFKTTILNLYKQHIESLSALDAPIERAEEVLGEVQPEEQELSQDEEILLAGEDIPVEEYEELQEEQVEAPVLGSAEPATPGIFEDDNATEAEEAPAPEETRPPHLFGGTLLED